MARPLEGTRDRETGCARLEASSNAEPSSTTVKPPGKVDQRSHGNQSPNIVSSSPVTINYYGLSPELTEDLRTFLKDRPKLEGRIRELEEQVWREQQGRETAELALRKYIDDYRALEWRLVEDDSELSRRAGAMLREGDLEGATKLLDEILARDEQQVDRAASNNFARGQAARLQFRMHEALPYYEKAYRYRPEAFDYAFAYADALQQQRQFREALPVDEEVARMARKLALANPAAYEPDVAGTLNNLGNLYSDTQRMGEAEKAFQEALGIRKRLALANPAAYEPYVAMTLNNLGVLYGGTQRMGEAEKAFQEALGIWRKLVVANPAAYEPYVATTLNNLGNLYRDTQRMGEAENVLSEPLTLRTKLFEKNPAVHGIDLVHVNLSLGIVKLRLGKTGEACALAQVVRELGVNPFPDWAAELERACLDR